MFGKGIQEAVLYWLDATAESLKQDWDVRALWWLDRAIEWLKYEETQC